VIWVQQAFTTNLNRLYSGKVPGNNFYLQDGLHWENFLEDGAYPLLPAREWSFVALCVVTLLSPSDSVCVGECRPMTSVRQRTATKAA